MNIFRGAAIGTQLGRFKYTMFGVFILVVLILIVSDFFNTWQQTNSFIDNQSVSVLDIQYAHLLTSQYDDPTLIPDAEFIESSLNEAPFKYGVLNEWFQIKIKNKLTEPQKLYLVLDNPMIDSLIVYQMKKTGAKRLIVTGDRIENIPKTIRTMPRISFNLAPNEEAEFRINAKTTGAPFLPIVIMNESDFLNYQKTVHMLWGVFVGIVLLMSAYNLVLFYGVGDTTYIAYVCYIYTMLLLLGVVHGFGYYIFPESVQLWLSDKIIALDSLAAFFSLQFALSFLRFTKEDGKIFVISQYFSIVLLGYTVFSIFTPEHLSASIFSVIQTITYIVAIWLVINKITSKFRWTKYYIFSWVPFFFGAAIGYLLYSGFLEYTFFNRHALMFSVIFEMAFISMALADRLGETEQQRLFQATHDLKLGLANESLLETAIHRYATHYNDRDFALITVEVSNYDAITPYVTYDELKELMLSLGKEFSDKLGQNFTLLTIDKQSTHHSKIALLQGQLLSFLIKMDENASLDSALKAVSNQDNFNPLQNIIPYRIHCIFGVAYIEHYAGEPTELINQAKQALNNANEVGRPYFIYDSNSSKNSDLKIRLAQDLGNAILDSTLELYHQPQFCAIDNDLISSEVLLRWQHPELGNIPPSEFVLIAEETGLIKHLTRWVIGEAFSQTKQLLKKVNTPLNVSINISANDLSRNGFVDDVEELIEKHNVDTLLFTLEITETTHLKDRFTFESNFENLRALGFKFAIDDFGTGYSSLSYANDHPFTELKIDRSFILDLMTSTRQFAIVSATISMAKQLGFTITAEGVEDKQTSEKLVALGCDKIQGYYIAKPMLFAQYLEWLTPNN